MLWSSDCIRDWKLGAKNRGRGGGGGGRELKGIVGKEGKDWAGPAEW